MIGKDDIDAFIDITVMDHQNTISVLEAEIAHAKSKIQPSATGHIYTAISWMEDRIEHLQNEIDQLDSVIG